jgi:hypothetical protein
MQLDNQTLIEIVRNALKMSINQTILLGEQVIG